MTVDQPANVALLTEQEARRATDRIRLSMPIAGIHPYADQFPMLPDDELAELAESIAANGLRQPVVITPEGLILDGRNRARACQQLGIEPAVEVYEGDDLAEYVIDSNTTRRHMSTGQRAMASALVLAADGRRSNGRWAYGSLAQLSESGQSSDFRKRVNEAGLILDYTPDLAAAVVAGDLTLNAAYTEADQHRRSSEADELARKAQERREREEAKAAAERDARIIEQLADTKYAALIEAGTVTPPAAMAAWMADTEKERRRQRELDDGRRNSLRIIQESVRHLGGGAQTAALFIGDCLPEQARLSPEGMWLTVDRIKEAMEYLAALKGALK